LVPISSIHQCNAKCDSYLRTSLFFVKRQMDKQWCANSYTENQESNNTNSTQKPLACSTYGTRRVTLVANPVISHEWGKNRIVITTHGTYPWPLVIHMLSRNVTVTTVKLLKWWLQLNAGHTWYMRYLRLFCLVPI
jgi:hypothetical protein